MSTDPIELINSLFNNLDLESSKEIDLEMATDYQLLRLSLDSIPHYDGNPHTLNVFIDNCDFLYNTFANANNSSLTNFILRAIIGKLTGRALMLIGSRIELKTWNEVKRALQLSFGDQRNVDCLIQDLIVLKPFKSESPYNFGMRCQDARSLIVSKINCSNMSAAEKMIRLESYDDLALKTYLRGLPGQLQTNVRLRNPDSLEKAMSLVIEEENFLYAAQRVNTLNSQTYKPAQKITPNTIQQNKPIPQFVPFTIPQSNFNNFRPAFQNNFRPPNFQRQTFNQFRPNFQNNQWQPNPNSNRNFSNQNSSFRPNFGQNNFGRPNQNFNNNNSKPLQSAGEPMDTSSGHTRFSAKPKPNWTATELFNQNIDQEPSFEFENPFENNSHENVQSYEQQPLEVFQENHDLPYYNTYCPTTYNYNEPNETQSPYYISEQNTALSCDNQYNEQPNDNDLTNQVNFCQVTKIKKPT